MGSFLSGISPFCCIFFLNMNVHWAILKIIVWTEMGGGVLAFTGFGRGFAQRRSWSWNTQETEA